jgi:hypothetical protein
MRHITPIALSALVALGCVEMEEEPELEETAEAITVTGERRVRLDRSLIAAEGESALDRDLDGLVDVQEAELAHAFRPYVVFDSGEHARQSFEPVTIFQVRPTLYRLDDLTVRVKLVFLFEEDGGYGDSSWCDDSHAGDNDDAWYELTSTDNGVNWTLLKVHLSFKSLEWPTNSAMAVFGSTHPAFYFSDSKHHEYFDTSWNGDDSYYSEAGCNEDVNGLGTTVLPSVTSLQVAAGYRNNIGEPGAHPTTYFVNSLDTYYPTESVWGGDAFFDVGPNTEKVMSFAKPPDVGHLAPAAATYLSGYTSEEKSAYPPATCANGHMVSGFGCSGRYCDNVRLRCTASGYTPTGVTSTSWFSEESTNYRICPSGSFVTGIDCSGSYCDNLRLECMYFAGASRSDCAWTPGWFSEEAGNITWSGKYLAGVKCSGSYCDNLSFYLCSP